MKIRKVQQSKANTTNTQDVVSPGQTSADPRGRVTPDVDDALAKVPASTGLSGFGPDDELADAPAPTVGNGVDGIGPDDEIADPPAEAPAICRIGALDSQKHYTDMHPSWMTVTTHSNLAIPIKRARAETTGCCGRGAGGGWGGERTKNWHRRERMRRSHCSLCECLWTVCGPRRRLQRSLAEQ